ncbi:hypothetical protein AltI4_00970 [Alteromonas sp. I4]|nr:hypothetical protein AltI4_00970 [Alteromonas sp. I4]
MPDPETGSCLSLLNFSVFWNVSGSVYAEPGFVYQLTIWTTCAPNILSIGGIVDVSKHKLTLG